MVQARMSVFEADSDLGRSHALPAGTPVPLHPWTAEVLQHAQALHTHTAGLFDVAQGSGRWCVLPTLAPHEDMTEGAALSLVRLDEATRLDLGGIAKGFAVDRAVQAALAAGAQAVWVNAGGDVRVHGASLAVSLRDEQHGGVRPWLTLEDGAVATSDFTLGARARLHAPGRAVGARHVSVAAPQCMLADALTKVVAAVGQADDPMVRELLALHGAQAWLHDGAALIA
jgi:thiamine biosynthesis lipoprotein